MVHSPVGYALRQSMALQQPSGTRATPLESVAQPHIYYGYILKNVLFLTLNQSPQELVLGRWHRRPLPYRFE